MFIREQIAVKMKLIWQIYVLGKFSGRGQDSLGCLDRELSGSLGKPRISRL